MEEDKRKGILILATNQSYLDKAKEKLGKFENNENFKKYVKGIEYELAPLFFGSNLVGSAIICPYGRFGGDKGLELLVEQLEEEFC